MAILQRLLLLSAVFVFLYVAWDAAQADTSHIWHGKIKPARLLNLAKEDNKEAEAKSEANTPPPPPPPVEVAKSEEHPQQEQQQAQSQVLIPQEAIKNLVVFGASYASTGFNSSKALPCQENPIGNPKFPGTTFAGGPNYVSFLTATYNSSLSYAYNFAFGGSTIDLDMLVAIPNAKSYVKQIDEALALQEQLPEENKWTKDNSLVLITGGVSDVGFGHRREDWDDLSHRISERYFEQTKRLLESGHFKRFILTDVPPIDKTPRYLGKTAEVAESERLGIQRWNEMLTAGAADLVEAYPDLEIHLLHTHPTFFKVIDNPTAYGAANASCENTDAVSCIWWNDYHPGRAIHDLLAKQIADVSGFW